MEPHCKHYEDVAEDAFDDEAHKGRAHFGSCYRDRTLAGSTGVEAAVREKDCQKEAARKVGKIYHDPALKQLRRCDLPVQDAEGQQVVAGEELSAAQDDQHQSEREERGADQFGNAGFENCLSSRRGQKKAVAAEADIDAGCNAQKYHFESRECRFFDTVADPDLKDFRR